MSLRIRSPKIVLLLLTAVLMLALVPLVSAQADADSYTVRAGDTLQSIANLFNITTDDIIRANGLAGPTLRVGQVLIIPPEGGAQNPQTYTVAPGDNLRSIATRFGVELDALLQMNNMTETSLIFPGQVLQIPPIGGPTQQAATPQQQVVVGTHTVAYGDTINNIARRYNVSADAIIAQNALVDPNHIFPGQVLQIPGATGPAFGTGGPVVVQNFTPIARGSIYIVQPGDTMLNIAARAGLSPFTIAQANGIFNLNAIFFGQRLFIP